MSDPKPRIRVTGLEWKDGATPYSSEFRDVYFAPSSGVEESRYVYLEGSGLLDAIHEQSGDVGTRPLTVAEIGFGVGLNFILTLEAFRSAPSLRRLNYFSFENRPVSKSHLESLYSAYPDHQTAAKELLEEYPVLTPGIHLLRFQNGRVNLYLCLGDANELLPRIQFKANHWFWDGFAPRRNPDAFSDRLFEQVALHSASGARGASFTSAGWVRRALETAGFSVSKRKGFGHKRECISATLITAPQGQIDSNQKPWFSTHTMLKFEAGNRVAVIGAGLGGTSIARALADRGAEVTVIDPHGIAGRASSNPIGLYNTQLSKIPNPVSRFSQLSLVHLIRELHRLGIEKHPGILRTDIRSPEPLIRADYPEDFYRMQAEGIFFPECGMIDPRALCRERLNHPRIRVVEDSVNRVIRSPGENPIELVLTGSNGSLRPNHVVYSLGADAKLENHSTLRDEFHDQNPTRPIRGQILMTEPTPKSHTLRHALVEEGYATPLIEGRHLIGATYQAKTIHPDQEEIDTDALIENARKWPHFSELTRSQVKAIKVGYRLSTPDKLPMIGPLCDPEWIRNTYGRILKGAKSTEAPPLHSLAGEWLLTGLGSRGITFSSLASEILACWMSGDPVPLETDLIEHIHSSRFFIRNSRKPEIR